VTHVSGLTTSDPSAPPSGSDIETVPSTDRPGPPDEDAGDGGEGGGGGDDGDRPERRGPALWQVILLVVALCGLAGVIGWRIGDAEPATPDSSSVDVGFYRDMTTHHQQAVTMALDYVRYGNDPLLLQIAREVATYQSSEIGMMQEYLAEWDADGVSSPTAMEWMGPPIPRGEMPGLATAAQMQQLAAARGAELDDLFTDLMINHHGGGVHMAATAARTAELASTRRWAAGMDDGQRGEISELNQWRARHGLDGIVPPLAEFTPPANPGT
jgi:uncharacterized protein (DUF305 family)